MKFSEAIRLGAMLAPQAFGELQHGSGTCALGAARQAIGLGNGNNCARHPPEWVEWMERHRRCPECGVLAGTLLHNLYVVAHLNDDHRWTREQIADWIEDVERAQEQPVATALETQEA